MFYGVRLLCQIYLDIHLNDYLNDYLNVHPNVHLDLYLTLHTPHLAATPLHAAEFTNIPVNPKNICSMASSFVNSKKTKTLKTT